jgi:hypothetical protein
MENEKLLELVGTALIPATGKFAGRDRVKLDTSDDADVRIAWFGTTFGIMFLDKVGDPSPESTLRYHRLRKPLTDGAVIAALGGENEPELVRVSEESIKLFVVLEREMRAAVDALESGTVEMNEFATRIRELRATQRELQEQRNALYSGVETTLAQVFALLEKQGKGEEGVLLVNGFSNIFYIRDINDVLRSVHVMCSSDGWLLYVQPAERPHRWNDGYQVFSQA